MVCLPSVSLLLLTFNLNPQLVKFDFPKLEATSDLAIPYSATPNMFCSPFAGPL